MNTSESIEPQYFPNFNYLKIIYNSTYVKFNVCKIHQKKSLTNRCRILGANGPILLSVPLRAGRNQHTLLKDIRIANDENWQTRHWRSIVSSYKSSPWFNHYEDELSGLYKKRIDALLEWNMGCMGWIFKILKDMPEYGVVEIAETGRLLDTMETHEPPVRYPQVFEDRFGFVPDLSILDMLFCMGPKSTLAFLKS